MNPLLTDTPVVTINGVEQNLPRLTLSAALKLPKLLNKLLTSDILSAFDKKEGSTDTERGFLVITSILNGLEDSEEIIFEILSHALGMPKEDVEKIPLEEVGNIIVAYENHPDISFFTKTLKARLKNQK